MPGTVDANLRSGNIHEQLGLVLLRGLALVAPVPRPEDAGVDAFATLLRPAESRVLCAEESFLVQLKASSVRDVAYANRQSASWLLHLEVPYFIGSVDVSASRMSLYATHRVQQAAIENEYDCVVLHLDPSREDSPAGARHLNLGMPVLEWEVSDLLATSFRERAYAVLKSHILLQQHNIRHRGVRHAVSVRWETVLPATAGGEVLMDGGDTPETDLSVLVPPLKALLLRLITGRAFHDVLTAFQFIDVLRRLEVPVSSLESLQTWALLVADGPDLTPLDIIALRSIPSPGTLDLSGAAITDESLAAVAPGTQRLALLDTPVTDRGIANLRHLEDLSVLACSNTAVTNASLRLLANMPNLTKIIVQRTRVTARGVAAFRKRRPEVTVECDWPAPGLPGHAKEH